MQKESIYSIEDINDVSAPIFAQMAEKIIEISQKAGQKILTIYHAKGGFSYDNKQDNSPVTQADLSADKFIQESLNALTPSIPILSEENLVDYEYRKEWTVYWLVDPLDGTREFIKKNGEFTVNIALIYHGRPILGVIHAPAKGVTYWGYNHQAFKQEGNEINRIEPKNAHPLKVSVSRSYRNEQLDELLSHIPEYEIKTVGSSLKFCWLAEGEIQYYPRANSISIWDIAAGEAILIAAGANMTDWDNKTIDYSPKQSFAAPPFKAWFGEV